MKKILLLLFVTALFQVNAQLSPSNPVVDAKVIFGGDVERAINAITVPDGKFWVVANQNGSFILANPDFSYNVNLYSGDIAPEGFKIFHPVSSNAFLYILCVFEYIYKQAEILLQFYIDSSFSVGMVSDNVFFAKF